MVMTSEMMEVLYYIPEGKKNAISRSELATSAGYSDRKIRNIIAQLQEEGYLVCNLSDRKGYFIAKETEIDEINAYYWQEKERALSIHRKLKAFRNILKKAGRKV